MSRSPVAAIVKDGGPDGEVILVVEDDANIRQLVATMLTGAGYRVARAGNGYEALAEVSRETPTIILLDLKLPKLDGWDLLQRLKADASVASVPIIVVTGDALPTHHEMARSRERSRCCRSQSTPASC
jgi:CheY-like chemotaxis protein